MPLHGEGFSTATFSLAVGIVEREFTGQLRLLPIHDRPDHIEERHGFDENFDSVGFHFQILVGLFEGVVEGVGESVTTTSFDTQSYPQRPLGVFAL